MRRLLLPVFVLSCLSAVASSAFAVVVLCEVDRTPREPTCCGARSGTRPSLVDTVDLVARWLIYADRLTCRNHPSCRLPSVDRRIAPGPRSKAGCA